MLCHINWQKVTPFKGDIERTLTHQSISYKININFSVNSAAKIFNIVAFQARMENNTCPTQKTKINYKSSANLEAFINKYQKVNIKIQWNL
jgi:hypothetical protein